MQISVIDSLPPSPQAAAAATTTTAVAAIQMLKCASEQYISS
jgi:hypothetical protein